MPKVKKNNAKIGVIILTYNASQFIKPCLTSVQNNIYDNFEILIVDNCSTDDTVKQIKKSFPTIKIIINNKNLGYAAGNNRGINYFLKKNFDYVLLLNPDTIVEKSLLKELVRAMQSTNKIGVAGPIITYMHQPDKIWFAGGYFNQTFCYTKHPYIGQSLTSLKIRSKNVDFITGACMCLRLSILKKTGLLPEKYFLYFEDSFFCQTVKSHGHNNYLLAKPLVRHIVSASTGQAGKSTLSPIRAYYYGRNPLLYIKSEVKGRQKITNFLGQFTIRLPHYFIQMLQEKNFPAMTAYLYGILDGLRK